MFIMENTFSDIKIRKMLRHFAGEKLNNLGNRSKLLKSNEVLYLLTLVCGVCCSAVLLVATDYKLNVKSNYKLDATPRDGPAARLCFT